jgi:ABC-2 type transport system permease protein
MTMVDDNVLVAIDEHGWRQGFNNLLGKENRAWWGTRKWLKHSLIWLAIVNGLLFIMLWVVPATEPGEAPPREAAIEMFVILSGVFTTVGVIVLAQGAIIGEKRSGTAEWIMSSPVSRPAFILAKLLANAWAIFLIMVVLQWAVFYAQISLYENMALPIGPFVATMALQSLHLFYFLALTLMLGSFFNSRAPVIGIALAILIGQDIVAPLLAKTLPWFHLILPQELMVNAQMVANGQPMDSWVPVIISSIMSLLFILVAIWRFGREEF